MRNYASAILIGVIFIGLLSASWSHPSFADSVGPVIPLGPTIHGPIPGAGGDPQWAIGAYATATGLATESTVWSNLPSSANMNGVTSVQFMVNTPLSAAGTVTYSGVNYNIIGVILQCVDYYSTPTTHFPDENLVFLATNGGNLFAFYQVPNWQNLPTNTGSVSESLSYTTNNSNTGWWCVMEDLYYLGVLNTNGFFTPNDAPTGTTWFPGVFAWTLTSLGTTSTVLSYGGSYWNPSIAMEVAEATSGNFFSDNQNFDTEANVGSGAFYYYGLSTGTGGLCSGTNHFLIGCDAAPGTAYGSGLTRTQTSGSTYYDEFGTSSGIGNWMSTNYQISSPVTTQTGGTNLPALNVQYYLTMSAGTGGSVSPSSGYYNKGQSVGISATANSGYEFYDWTATSGLTLSNSNANPSSVTVGAAGTVTGNFNQLASQYYLTMQVSGNGYVSPASGYYSAGTHVIIKATPNPGCVSFSKWSGVGYYSYSGTSNPYTLMMSGPVTETAIFVNKCAPTSGVVTTAGMPTPLMSMALLSGLWGVRQSKTQGSTRRAMRRRL